MRTTTPTTAILITSTTIRAMTTTTTAMSKTTTTTMTMTRTIAMATTTIFFNSNLDFLSLFDCHSQVQFCSRFSRPKKLKSPDFSAFLYASLIAWKIWNKTVLPQEWECGKSSAQV